MASSTGVYVHRPCSVGPVPVDRSPSRVERVARVTRRNRKIGIAKERSLDDRLLDYVTYQGSSPTPTRLSLLWWSGASEDRVHLGP